MSYENEHDKNLLDNLISFLKIKTYVWDQLIFKKKDICINASEVINSVKLMENKNIQEINNQQNNFKIVFKYNNNFFIFQVMIPNNITKNFDKIKINEKILKENYENGYVFPEIFYFGEKIKASKEFNQIPINLLYIDPKNTFKHKLIYLIDNNKYKQIQQASYSKYNNQNSILKILDSQDINLYIFYHPELCKITDICGYKTYFQSPNSVYDTDYTFFKN